MYTFHSATTACLSARVADLIGLQALPPYAGDGHTQRGEVNTITGSPLSPHTGVQFTLLVFPTYIYIIAGRQAGRPAGRPPAGRPAGRQAGRQAGA